MDGATLDSSVNARGGDDSTRSAEPVRREIPTTADAEIEPATTPGPRTWPWLLFTIAFCTILFALLHNPYWSPGGDSEVYTAVARNIAQGDGYMFNGAPYALSPPGWPLLLAGLMKISPTFAFLKAAQIVMMVGALAMFFQIGTRLAPPALAAIATCLAALLHPLYQLTFLLHSEPLYMLLGTSAVLVALRVGEGSSRWLGVIGACVLAALAVIVRDAGLFHFMLIGGAFAMGLRRGLPNGTWLRSVGGVLLCGVVMAGTFKISRELRTLTDEQAQQVVDAGGIDAGSDETEIAAADDPEVEILDAETVAGTQVHTNILAAHDENITVAQEQLYRAGRSGQWFAWLLWHPMRFGASVPQINILAHATGWLTISLLLVTLGVGLYRKQWLWLGVALYCAAFILAWPQVNNRYLVPAAPLIILGVLVGLRHVTVGKFRWPGRVLAAAFVLAILGNNGVLYAVDVAIARSGEAYYDRFENGEHKDLIAACKMLHDADVADRDVAITVRYSNLGRTRESAYGLRAAVLLTDANVIRVGRKDTKSGRSARLTRHVRELGANWYIYREPDSPWRVWHFRLTREQQEQLTGEKVGRDSRGWILYRDEDGKSLTRTDAPDPGAWPTRVPGL
ncbi:MAG: hypothetical protein AAGD32_03175 [Planctomycetota bacterium]